MKKILTAVGMTIALSATAFATETEIKSLNIDIESKIGAEIFKSELAYANYLKNESIQNLKITTNSESIVANNCEIAKLKKALVKLIKERNVIDTSPVPSSRVATSEFFSVENVNKKIKSVNSVVKKKEKEICTKTKKIVNTDRIHESYYSFKNPKTFKVTYSVAGLFKFPVLGIERDSLLKRGDIFKADMYTKAGWVHVVDKGWIKGYKIFPRVKNNTSKKDIEKWSSTYKIIKDCK